MIKWKTNVEDHVNQNHHMDLQVNQRFVGQIWWIHFCLLLLRFSYTYCPDLSYAWQKSSKAKVTQYLAHIWLYLLNWIISYYLFFVLWNIFIIYLHRLWLNASTKTIWLAMETTKKSIVPCIALKGVSCMVALVLTRNVE